MKRLVMLVVLCLYASVSVAGPIGCKSKKTWNPLTTNWNNTFPIVTAGIKTDIGGHPAQPSKMKMPPICECGNYLPVGVGVTYWQPSYLAEVVDMPGCLPTLGGTRVLSGGIRAHADTTRAGGTTDRTETGPGDSLRNMNVHWYTYPVFAVLEVFSTLACGASNGFDIADMTEVDPTWGNSLLADSMHPLTFLVANLPAQLACIPDAVAASARLPIDALFWCMGSQGSLYPAAGWTDQESNGIADSNFLMVGKYMQNRVEYGGMLTTIGKRASCESVYKPTLTRSQYRFEPIDPIPSNRTAVMGRSALQWAFTPPLNAKPNRDDNSFLVWQGKQCCVL